MRKAISLSSEPQGSGWPVSTNILSRSLDDQYLLRFAAPADGPARGEIGGAATQPDVVAIDGNGLSKTIDNPKRISAPRIACWPDHWRLVGVLSNAETSGLIRVHSPPKGSDNERRHARAAGRFISRDG